MLGIQSYGGRSNYRNAPSTKSGYRGFPFNGSVTTVLLGNGLITFMFHKFDRPIAISKWGVQISTAGDAGSLVRIGKYAPETSSVNAHPGQLIQDYGTVSTASTGYKEIATNEVVYGTFFMAAVTQGVTVTAPTFYALGNSVSSNMTGLAPSGAANVGAPNPYQTGVTGALPSAATSPATNFTQFQIIVYFTCA